MLILGAAPFARGTKGPCVIQPNELGVSDDKFRRCYSTWRNDTRT